MPTDQEILDLAAAVTKAESALSDATATMSACQDNKKQCDSALADATNKIGVAQSAVKVAQAALLTALKTGAV